MSGGDYSHNLDLSSLDLSECHVNEALTKLQPIVAKRAFGFFQEKPEIKICYVTFLSFIVPIFAWNVSLGISNFLEEIFSLSHSIVFLYFFALITEKGFLISPCYSLELCIQMGISFLFCLVKALVFPVVRYGCESWAIKKVECQRIDAFELWCWRRLLRVPWTASRSNQSILKEISHECSLEGLILRLKLQYFGHLMRKADSFEKTLILGKIEGRRRRGWQRMRCLDGNTDSTDTSLGKLRELVMERGASHVVVHGVSKS